MVDALSDDKYSPLLEGTNRPAYFSVLIQHLDWNHADVQYHVDKRLNPLW